MQTFIPVRVVRNTALLVAALVLLCACSMARLLYDQADWLLLREMDSYLDLRDEQRDHVAGMLAVSLDRHRSEQLPRFASALRGAAERARSGISHADAHWVMQQGRELLVATAGELLPTLATTLAGLDAEQRAHLRARLLERNRDYHDEHWLDRSREDRFERRAQKTVERIEGWTGPLSPEQAELIASIRNAMPDSAGAWLAYTQRQQQHLMTLLDSGAPVAAIQAHLEGWWLRLRDMPDDLQRMRDERTAGMREILVRLGATLDSMQRAHLIRRLESLAEDASSLAVAA